MAGLQGPLSPRRTQFCPIAVTAPRFFPVLDFTGRRRTVIFDAEGNIDEEIKDNWVEDRVIQRA